MARCRCSKPGDLPRCTLAEGHKGPHECQVTWGSDVHLPGERLTWQANWKSDYQPPMLRLRPEEEFLRDVKLASAPPEFWTRIR